MARTKNYQRIKQPVSAELSASLMDFIRRKFYAGDDKCFYQDRRDLMRWAVLWPASWLDAKGVTIHGERYREICFKVLLQANAHAADKIKYRPVWLKAVLQNHFKIHGEEYLAEAKSVLHLAEQVLLMVGNRVAAPDPVLELAKARQILVAGQPKKKASKTVVKGAVNLELSLG